LVGVGLNQAINLPFVSVEELTSIGISTDGSDLLTVKNPLREEESKLRPSLLPGLLNDVRYNMSHGVGSVALFEAGTVFFVDADPEDSRLPLQYDRLAWAVVGDAGLQSFGKTVLEADAHLSLAIWRHVSRVMDVTAELVAAEPPGFHPGRAAAVVVGGRRIGHVGELSPSAGRAFDLDVRVAVAELDMAPILEPPASRLAVTPSVFPHVDFDLSFLVSIETTAAELIGATSRGSEELIESVRVFDEFRGDTLEDGTKALALTYRLRAPNRTLDAREIARVRQTMIDAASAMGARLRGAE
jgi:phenylalanyl-tRNA synthetase beta chain